MEKIDQYLENVYKDFKGNQEEVNELKSEMKEHLLQMVKELKEEGKTEEEALLISFERFGDEKLITSELEEVFNDRQKVAPRLLRTSLSFLLLGVILFAAMVGTQQYYSIQRNKLDNLMYDTIRSKNEISAENKQHMESLFNQYGSGFTNVVIFKVSPEVTLRNEHSSIPFDFNLAEWKYPQNATNPEPKKEGGFSAHEDNQWLFQYEYRWHFAERYASVISIICFGLLSVYWVLFTIWAILNAKVQKRLNWAWTIAFSFFNFVAYIIYRSEKKQVKM